MIVLTEHKSSLVDRVWFAEEYPQGVDKLAIVLRVAFGTRQNVESSDSSVFDAFRLIPTAVPQHHHTDDEFPTSIESLEPSVLLPFRYSTATTKDLESRELHYYWVV